jgi:hypothetical protein
MLMNIGFPPARVTGKIFLPPHYNCFSFVGERLVMRSMGGGVDAEDPGDQRPPKEEGGRPSSETRLTR